ncbi:hypothetical protein [uncultured Pelagibacterium sp.]|uniref:hypothetical protein n=1 Tax=uncultured Pelagibacterium sp. TaxID=1159875 RepID=UPI0030D98E76|tara:strand:- start:4075 stop:5268 length:1194 start_codon:yes stop_codon:yes gene_type:complete
MPRRPPPASGPAQAETLARHLAVGRRWLKIALAQYPGLAPEAALAAWQKGLGPIKKTSARRYRADLRHTLLDHLSTQGRIADFPRAFEAVDAALTTRIAQIREKRTSAKKVVDATKAETDALFIELKRHGLKYKNPNSILCGLFTLIAGHLGFRPVELRGARLVGTILTVPNAKKRPGHAPERSINIAPLDPDVVKGTRLMLDLIDHDLSKSEFAAWEKTIAEQMRRACIRIKIRELSPYSFRHVAIAAWSAAGLSPDEIARLCGHLSIRTAHTHYARASVGHKRNAVARAALSADTEALPPVGENNAPSKETQRGAENRQASPGGPIFDVNDMPQPGPKADTGPPALSAEEVRRRFDRLVDPRDPREIAANLARANREREAKDPRHRPDGRTDDPS